MENRSSLESVAHDVSKKDLIKAPSLVTFETQRPVPNPQDPITPTKNQIATYYYWSVVISDLGTVAYDFSCMIMDRSGNAQGYFQGSLSITINGDAPVSSS